MITKDTRVPYFSSIHLFSFPRFFVQHFFMHITTNIRFYYVTTCTRTEFGKYLRATLFSRSCCIVLMCEFVGNISKNGNISRQIIFLIFPQIRSLALNFNAQHLASKIFFYLQLNSWNCQFFEKNVQAISWTFPITT